MKILKMVLPVALLAVCSTAAFAGPVVLNMSGLGDEEAILNYFNGGYGGNGSGPGPADGIVFSSNSLAIISESQGGSGNFDNNPSGGPIAFFLSGSADTMDVAAGFNTGFSFYYSTIETGSVTVWSGLDGTGTLLATPTRIAIGPKSASRLPALPSPLTLAAPRTTSASTTSPSVRRPPAAAPRSPSRAASICWVPAWLDWWNTDAANCAPKIQSEVAKTRKP